MFCPNCGANVGDARFCPECGTEIGEAPENMSDVNIETPVKRKKSNTVAGFILMLVAIFPVLISLVSMVFGMSGLVIASNIFGFGFSIVGLILAIMGQKQMEKWGGMSIVTIIFCILEIILLSILGMGSCLCLCI